MNTAPLGWCQCAPGRRLRWGWRVLFLGVLTLSRVALAADASPAPAPSPPAWQQELAAALVLQTAVTLAPAANPADDAERHRRLGLMYAQLTLLYPDEAAVQKAAGEYYGETSQTSLALACWQRAETLDPHDAATADALGSAFLGCGQVRDACLQYERAVAAKPDVAAYHFDLANVLFLFRRQVLAPPGRPDEQAALTEALGHFRRAAELAPADRSLAQAYAETFYIFAQPDWEQALAAWKNVLALSGGDTDFANGHLARVSLRLGRAADAETYLDRIRSPQYDVLKRKFRQRAAALPSATP